MERLERLRYSITPRHAKQVVAGDQGKLDFALTDQL
jgi:hypothetical protein